MTSAPANMHPVDEAEAEAEAKEGGAEDKVDDHNDMGFFFLEGGLVSPILQARGTHISPRVFFGFLTRQFGSFVS